MTSRGRFGRLRRVALSAQAVVWLGLPWVTIGGESALRLDVPAGRLHAFGGSFAIDEAIVVLAALLLVTAVFLWVTVLWGRVWCGWSCPQTLLSELTALVEAKGKKRRWHRRGGYALIVLVSVVVSANLLWYFESPYAFFDRLASGTLGPVLSGAWIVLGAILFVDLAFVRARFCATTCPYAVLQGVLFDAHTLVVAYDPDRHADCVDCGACVRVCPTGIDIRNGLQMQCIACAACIDACAPIMAKVRRPPDLIGYFYGRAGGRPRLLRPLSLALGGAGPAALVLLVVVLAGRSLLSMNALPASDVPARRLAADRFLNGYSLALENHSREAIAVSLSLAAGDLAVELRPASVKLAAGERRQVRLIASVRGTRPPGRIAAALTAHARAGDELVAQRTQRVSLLIPEEDT